jgi:hypothetical protein
MIDQDNVFDLNAILHPASVFDHPRDVIADPTISIGEKRAILASWASDAAAVASNPALRELPGSHPVKIDEILEALSALDLGPPKEPPGGKESQIGFARGSGSVTFASRLPFRKGRRPGSRRRPVLGSRSHHKRRDEHLKSSTGSYVSYGGNFFGSPMVQRRPVFFNCASVEKEPPD